MKPGLFISPLIPHITLSSCVLFDLAGTNDLCFDRSEPEVSFKSITSADHISNNTEIKL